MPSMPSPIRLAFVAALAAFALGACSGGGGKPTTTAGTLTEGDRTDFFPIPSGQEQVTRGTDNFVPAAGSTLETLVPREHSNFPGTSAGIPQFSVFEFGSYTNSNGIPLQKATKEDDSYTAIAYQAVLNHSMFLIQGGIYTPDHSADTGHPAPARRQHGLGFSTGAPSTGSPVAGTWEGRAVGVETLSSFSGSAPAPKMVQADVEIGVTLDGGNQNVTWAFRDWEGGSREYPDLTHDEPIAPTLFTEENVLRILDPDGSFTAEERAAALALANNDHRLLYGHVGRLPYQGSAGWKSKVLDIQFYGPGRREAGGRFDFHFEDGGQNFRQYFLDGVFAAKKQP